MRFGADVIEGGTRFRVWAPRPRQLELEVSGQRLTVPRDALGWGEVVVPGVGPGARYCYVLDGDRRRPDPASRSQPEGVHAPSEVVDPTRYRWQDTDTLQPPLTSLYELHVGTFSPAGTFDGVAERLADLQDLGFDVLELMPVATWAGPRGWGYDGVTWLAPHAAYGGPERLRALVDACHQRGMAVVLDVVFNHLGPEGNYLGEYGPYFTDRHTGWGEALDLDGSAAGPVRAFILHAARALVAEFHLDGLRLDAVHALVDRSPQHLVAELSAALHADGEERGRPVWVIAESDLGTPRVVEPAEEGGWGCDALWHDDFHDALQAALTGEQTRRYADFGRVSQVARTLERGFCQTGRRSIYRGRRYGEPAAHLDGRRIVVYAQNHDQVGNRTFGERLSTLVPGCAHAVAVALLTSPFLPLVFMGEEYGEVAPFPFFTSFGDAVLGRAVRAARRREYGAGAPDPQDPATLEMARLRPANAGARGEGLRRLYRTLLGLRRTRPSLAAQPLARTEAIAEGQAVVVRRASVREETLAVYKLGPEATQLLLPIPRHGEWRMIVDAGDFGGPQGAQLEGERLSLPGYGAIVCAAP
jgi:maltooligosyltrehalose trehalohydrolase